MSRYEKPPFPVHTRAMTEQPVTDDHRRGEAISGDKVVKLWQSREFHATLYIDGTSGYPRLTISRVEWDTQRQTFRDGITWDELMRVKRECGYADKWAVELYPPDADAVGVHALRHLWFVPEAPPFAWTDEHEEAARQKRIEVGRDAVNHVNSTQDAAVDQLTKLAEAGFIVPEHVRTRAIRP
jgi:hypothetical protein